MAERRRIGVITTSFPRSETDFAGRFVFELSREFSRHGYRVDVVVPEPSEKTDWISRPRWLEGLSVFPAPYFRPRRYESLFFGAGVPDNLRSHPACLGFVLPALLSLYMRSRRLSPHWDGLITHWLFPSAFIGGLSRTKQTPHLAIAHSGDVHLLGQPGMNLLHRRLCHLATRFGFISKKLETDFLKSLSSSVKTNFEGRTHITPMGVDAPAFENTRSAQADKTRPFTILFLGRLVPIKGVALLLDAVSELDGVELLVAGDGPLQGELERQARQRSLPIRFLGRIAPDDRPSVFQLADAFVLPSFTSRSGRNEGLPLTLLEAMAAGIPIIASNTGSVAELIIHRRNGLLFPERQIDALKRCIAELRDDNSLRTSLVNAALETARSRTWSTLFPVFERLLGIEKASS